jgi:hypothetical protein
VCGDVATFVIARTEYKLHRKCGNGHNNRPVDGDVESEQFNKTFVLTEPEEGCKIVRVILCGIDGWKFTLAKDIAVDTTGDVRQLGNPTRDVKRGPTPQEQYKHTDPSNLQT